MIKISEKIKKIACISILTLLPANFLFCSSLHENYNHYKKGYETGKQGGSKPLLWSNKAEKEGYEAGLNEYNNKGKTFPIVDFEYTKEELKALEKNWNTFDEMLQDALSGNSNAMFAVGVCYFYGGKGLPVDFQMAKLFFAKAASLGHAPSLEKIRDMYINDTPNLFLHHVYLNLIIAMGHTEYSDMYHRLRSEIIQTLGPSGKKLVDEIERIAHEKILVIYKNQDDLERTKKGKDSLFLTNLNDITREDIIYNPSYWANIAGIKE